MEEYKDKSLGQVITSEKQREKLMYAYGLADLRDFKGGAEQVEKEAEKNLEARIEKENKYMDEPIARALHQAEHGIDFQPELRARLEEAKKESVEKQDHQRELMKEADERRARDRR